MFKGFLWKHSEVQSQISIDLAFCKKLVKYLVHLWLLSVSITAPGLSLVAAAGGLFVAGARVFLLASLLLGRVGPRAHGLQWLWHMVSAAPQRVGSSWTREETHVFCVGRQILNHWTTRDVLDLASPKETWSPVTVSPSLAPVPAAVPPESAPPLTSPTQVPPSPGMLQGCRV